MRVRSDRLVNWWSAAALVTVCGTALAVQGPEVSGAVSEPAAAAETAAMPAGEVLDRVSLLLSQDKPVRAHAIVMSLIASDASLTLSDAETKRALQLMGASERAVRGLPVLEADLQRAEWSAASGRLGEAERTARAVLTDTRATDGQRERARAVQTLSASRRAILAREADRVLGDIESAFAAADYAGAKALSLELAQTGVDLSPGQRAKLRSYQDRIQQLEMVRGEPFASETLALSAFQPGQPGRVRRAPFGEQPATEPETNQETAAAATEAAGQPVDPSDAATEPGAAGDEVPDEQEDLIQAVQQLEAQRLFAEADRAFEEARFAQADRTYTRLLNSFRPFLDAAQIDVAEQRRDESRIRLGRGVTGSPTDIIDIDIERRTLARQQALAQYRNETQQAEDRLASGGFEQARLLASGALLTLNNNRSVLGVAEYEQFFAENSELRRRIAAADEEARIRSEDSRRQDLLREERERELESAQQREQRILRLIDSIRALQLDQQYEKAIQETDQLLFIDPNNAAGLILKDVLTETMLLRAYDKSLKDTRIGVVREFTDNRQAMVPPDNLVDYPDDWADISRRRGNQLEFSETPMNRAVLATLRDTRLPVNFQDAALEDVLTFLGQFANLEQDVDWPSLEELGIDPEALVTLRLTNVPLETVYDRVLEKVSDPSAQAGWAVNDGVLTIASDDVLRRNTVLEIYDIRDLLIDVPNYDNAPEFDLNTIFQQGGQGGGGGGGGQSPFGQGQQDPLRADREELVEGLRDIIQSNVDPEGWEDLGGETGTIQELNGNFVITNTPKNHRAITGLLNKLRSVRNMQINVESRFLLVREEWFEQIGFDIDVFIGENLNEVEIARTIDPSLTIDDFFDPESGELRQVIPGTASGFGITQPVFAPGTQGDQFSPIRAQQDSFGLTEALGGSLTPIADAVTGSAPALGVAGRFLDDIQVDFLVEATQADRRSVELTAPRLTFTNGQTAYVFVATQFSFVSDLQPVVSDSAVGFDPTISVVSEGVVLEIDGVISADRRYVTMNVDTAIGEVNLESSVSVEATAGGGGFSIDPDTGTAIPTATVAEGEIQTPVVTITRVQTTVTVPDQGTILLGGQRVLEEFETETGVPVLSKIPVLNRFFSNRIETKEELTLLILLKPTVLIQSEEEERNFPGLLDSLR
ncbi:MAG: hypothetical protein AAF297_07470 [Planctomycetota bacterium]